MAKRRDRVNYRKIYEENFGPIPKDENGRSFDIDHVDGDPTNHDLSNLRALSIKDHFDKHYNDGDFLGARAIAMRMNVSPEEASHLASLAAKQRVENGTSPFGHHWNEKLKDEGRHPWVGGDQSRKNALKLVEEGRHPFSGGKIQSETQKRLVKEGKHPWQGSAKAYELLSAGTHNFQKKKPCPHCDNYIGRASDVMWHIKREHPCVTPQ